MVDPQKQWVSILKWSRDLDDLGVLSWHKKPPHCIPPTDSFRNQLCLGMEFINYCWVVGERLSQASIILKRRTEDGEATSYKLQPPKRIKIERFNFSCNLVLFYGLLITYLFISVVLSSTPWPRVLDVGSPSLNFCELWSRLVGFLQVKTSQISVLRMSRLWHLLTGLEVSSSAQVSFAALWFFLLQVPGTLRWTMAMAMANDRPPLKAPWLLLQQISRLATMYPLATDHQDGNGK